MKYLLLLHVEEAGLGRLAADEQAARLAEYRAFTEALSASGALVGSNRLAPSQGAKLVRTKGGRPVVTDGPFAETKEQVAGYYLIEAANEAAAVEWAAKCPACGHGAVEVRALYGEA